MRVFFEKRDYETYRDLLLEQTQRYRVSVWAYCLMPNHVHLIAVPADGAGLARSLAEAHRRYAKQVNSRHGWRGHLWQERFWSFPMDERHLRAVARYVLLNPVRAGLARQAEDWPFSSARAHTLGEKDALVTENALERCIGDWEELLRETDPACEVELVRRHSSTGRPLGDRSFEATIEGLLGRSLQLKPSGRPRSAPAPRGGHDAESVNCHQVFATADDARKISKLSPDSHGVPGNRARHP